LETCRDHLGEHDEAGSVEDFDAFAATCLELDGSALVEYAIDLLDKGCAVDLRGLTTDGRRRVQSYLAPRLSSDNEACSWDQVDDFALAVDRVCCGADGALCPAEGPPTSCSAACAVTFHQFTQTCAATLDRILPTGDRMRADMMSFDSVCVDAADASELFLQAIMNAHCPDDGDIVILRENGASAAGWTNTEVTDVGSAGVVHGPWGNDATDVTLEVTIPEGITDCEVSWRSWAIDSRDNEVDRVLIDGAEVWSNAASCNAQGGGDGWELGPSDFPNPYGGADEVCFAANIVEVKCSGTMVLNFVSGINQAEADESWAFSDVTVIGSNGAVVILDEFGASADGWSNSEVTDVGSAGMVHGPWGNDATDVSIEITIPVGLAHCEVSWRSWAIDSRDNEIDRVVIDGNEVWAQAAHSSCPDQWEQGPTDFPNPYGGENEVCFDIVTVQVSCLDTMLLNFLSGIDQGEADEAWAFSDVRVVGRPDTEEEAAARKADIAAGKIGKH
jgi:hypothetical protein